MAAKFTQKLPKKFKSTRNRRPVVEQYRAVIAKRHPCKRKAAELLGASFKLASLLQTPNVNISVNINVVPLFVDLHSPAERDAL